MPTIVYLDAEDEITSAAARIRSAADTRVGLVLPFGSRVATSRINFKLLSREAMHHGRRLDIVAPDASARALAASAGLPVFASVGEYEAALDVEDDERDARRAAARASAGLAAGGAVAGGMAVAGTSAAAEPEAGIADAGATAGIAGAGIAGAGIAGAGAGRPAEGSTGAPRPVAGTSAARPDDATRRMARPRTEPVAEDAGARDARDDQVARGARRRRRTGLVAALLLLVLAAGGVAAGAYLLLPSAAITVTPRIEPIGPITFQVRADPAATAVDPKGRVIPAQTLTVPVDTEGEYPATGKRVERTEAHGAARWTNCDPTSAYRIPAGTVVRTGDGVAFTTDEEVFLPVATLSGGGATPKLECQSSEVAVTAVEPGPGGNVGAGEIRVVPAKYNRTVIRVNNPDPTSGGTRQEFTRVSQKDVDDALKQAAQELRATFTTEVGNPSRVPPGMTVFPDTAVLGDAVPTVDPQTLVGQEVKSFTLGANAEGTVLAVDDSPAAAIAEERLAGSVSDGYELVEGSTTVDVGDGSVVDGVITFPVEASAKQVRPLDAAALKASVLGLPAAEATRVLEPYGAVAISLWPDWVSAVPSLDQRVTLTLGAPAETTPSPEPSGPVPSGSGATDSAEPDAGGAASDEPVPSAG